MFCDEIKIKLIAGKGGDGSASFRREKFVPRGGPDGGDGGHGGNIVFQVDGNLNTLSHLSHQKVYRAQDGGHGRGQKMAGRKGEDLILKVPQGTIILSENKSNFLHDLEKENSQFVAARGGKGGLGNVHFKSSTYQTPKFAENGEPGEEKEIVVELKLVADVGIIGLPSAGKSTLISVISNAKPKIADYPFTTLVPNLGVVNMQKHGAGPSDNFVIADIPGLIEGASEGKGLGHQFLKHVSRTKLLVHLIDGYLENPDHNYKIIRNELKKFDKNLAKNEEIIVLNKIDILDEKTLKTKIKELKKVTKTKKIICISAVARKNLNELLFEIVKNLRIIKKATKVPAKSAIKTVTVLQPKSRQNFSIEKVIRKKDHKIFRITGSRIEQLIVMTNIQNPEGLERVYHFFDKMGIRKAIEKQGATYGDIIRIKEKNIPYRK